MPYNHHILFRYATKILFKLDGTEQVERKTIEILFLKTVFAVVFMHTDYLEGLSLNTIFNF